MLQQVLEYLNNYFAEDDAGTPYHVERGTFAIPGGLVSLPFLQDGQRFEITGSALNDGVYTYHPGTVTDDDDIAGAALMPETFTGTITALAVPPALRKLSDEIRVWVDKYGDVVNSPYQSEDVIGVYSYVKAQNSKVGGQDPTMGWQTQFGKRLKRWKKGWL